MIVIQFLRSMIFHVVIYVGMVIVAIGFLPWMLVDKRGAHAACHAWCYFVFWCARWIIGLKCEVRGTPPTDEVLVAGKHQSFLDIIMIYGAMPRGKFIMKKEILYTPIVGQYGLRIGCIPVDRGKRGIAIKKMVADVAAGRSDPGQLIIFPQGTRVPVGEKRPYKIGSAVLYRELNQDCVPVAVNVGVTWPSHGLIRHSGTAVVEFLPRIKPGLSTEVFMERLEATIETASDKLAAEALGK